MTVLDAKSGLTRYEGVCSEDFSPRICEGLKSSLQASFIVID
jgi:hypothetical protein